MHNNHPDQLWYFKIASLWSHHETSLFFTVCIYNVVNIPLLKTFIEQRFLSIFNVLLTIYLILDANPFALSPPEYIQATSPFGLNPLLYDKYMVWHPPLLYIGQALLFTPYVRAIVYNDITKSVLRFSFGTLGIAISLGAIWAFTQLGWGGFWFWDPVETASLLPLLSTLIILHIPSIWRQKNPWLMCLPFGFVMISTWLVRSGILTSVHSFAQSPTTFVILGIYATLAWLPMIYYSIKIHYMKHSKKSNKIVTIIKYAICIIILTYITKNIILAIFIFYILNTIKKSKKIIDKYKKLIKINPVIQEPSSNLDDNTERQNKTPLKKPFLVIGIMCLIMMLIILMIGLFAPFFDHFIVNANFFNTSLSKAVILSSALIILHTMYIEKIVFSSSISLALSGTLIALLFEQHEHLELFMIVIASAACIGAMIPWIAKKPKMALAHIGFFLMIIGFSHYNLSPSEATLRLTPHQTLRHSYFDISFNDIEQKDSKHMSIQTANIKLYNIKDGNQVILHPQTYFFHRTIEKISKAHYTYFDQSIVMITAFDLVEDKSTSHQYVLVTFHVKYGILWMIIGILLLLISLLPKKFLILPKQTLQYFITN